eukprot:1279395-Ditylum_brightwellii.AAC.1
MCGDTFQVNRSQEVKMRPIYLSENSLYLSLTMGQWKNGPSSSKVLRSWDVTIGPPHYVIAKILLKDSALVVIEKSEMD